MSTGSLARDITELLRTDGGVADVSQRAVDVGTSHLGVGHGHFTRIVPELDHWEAVASTDGTDGPVPIGTTVELQKAFCRHAVSENDTVAFDLDPSDDVVFQRAEWSCYLTTPVRLDDELYGTLCFADTSESVGPFDETDTAVAECLAEVLGTEIARDERGVALRNRNRLLGILSRILRHNFRNDMTVVQGYVNRLLDRIDDPGMDEAILRATVEDVISLAGKSNELREIAESDPALTEQSITTMLDRVIEAVGQEHPDATFRQDTPEDVRLIASPTLETALHELLENAAGHAAPDPVCEITVDADADAVTVTVADNGEGLPESERHVLRGEPETALSHGKGVGLWIVRWVIESHNGTIETTASDAGTEVSVTLPRPLANERLFEATL